MKVREDIYRGTRKTTTDENGNFTFSPKIDDDYASNIFNDARALPRCRSGIGTKSCGETSAVGQS